MNLSCCTCLAVVALKSRCTTGGGPCGLGGGRDPLRCVGNLGETRTRVRPERRSCGCGPALSPWPPWPAGPPMSPELAEALLVGAAAVTPPEAEDPQWEDIILPSS